MRLLSRLATLETLHRAQIEAMTVEELCARLDATYGSGTGAFLWAYMDGMTIDELDALHGGNQQLAQQVWAAYDAWREEQS